MLKTTLAALALTTATLLAVPTLSVLPAHATVVGCDGGPCDEGGGESSQPPSGDEGNDGNGHGGPGGNGGDLDPLTPEQRIARLEQTCNAALQKLARVTEPMVEAFSPEGSVSVVAVCNSGLGHKAEIDGSQALPLQSAIAANPAMAGALQQQGFHVEDVVGIIVSNGIATLYAHKGTV